MAELGSIPARVDALVARYQRRDVKMGEVQSIRRGEAHKVAPNVFSDSWPQSIVANMIDTAARDVAGVLAPLPAFNCTPSTGLNQKAKDFADKRTKIVRSYLESSEFAWQMLKGADQYNSYGMLVIAVEPDFECSAPRISVEDAVGAYPVWDNRGRTREMARVYERDYFALEADYPLLRYERAQHPMGVGANNKVKVVKYVSASRVVVYLPDMGNFVLEDMPNPLGRCFYVCVQRPGLDDEIRGAYDDVIWVQLARHRIQMLLMEGVSKAVQAPLIVTPDVTDVPTGPDAVIPAQGGVNSVGRARLDMPNQAFAAVDQLKQEQQLGSMSPEARSGNIDASIVTGRGVQQLMAGFSTQIAVAQTVFAKAFKEMAALLFEMDEKLFGSMEKSVRGKDAGVPYSIKYTPNKDIDGDYSVDVTYGFAAGMDPNRALVFLLQAKGANAISDDYLMRNLPVDINVSEEQQKIAMESSRQALLAGMAAMAASIPQIVTSGGDPTEVLRQQTEFIKLLTKGKSVEEAAELALAPKQVAPQATPPGVPPGSEAMPPPPPGGEAPGGVPPMQDQGRPPLQMLLAGLTSAGKPNLQAAVSRQIPAA